MKVTKQKVDNLMTHKSNKSCIGGSVLVRSALPDPFRMEVDYVTECVVFLYYLKLCDSNRTCEFNKDIGVMWQRSAFS